MTNRLFLIGGIPCGEIDMGAAVAECLNCRCISTDSLAKHPEGLGAIRPSNCRRMSSNITAICRWMR